MPSSRRDKKVSLTKTAKKGMELKKGMVADVRRCVDEHSNLFVFTYQNLRSRLMKDVRMDFTDGRFFMGKNKVMMLALGRTAEDEYQDNLRNVSKHLRGQVGLLFTNKTKEEVEKYFQELSVPDFATAGFVPDETSTIDEGPMEGWPVSMMEQFRKLGLVIEIEDGVLMNRKPFTMCKQGFPLTPEQAKLLSLFNRKLSVFRINLACFWCDGQFEQYAEPGQGAGAEADNDAADNDTIDA